MKSLQRHRPFGFGAALTVVVALTAASFAPNSHGAEPTAKPAAPDPNYIRKLIPEKISGSYPGGELIPLRVHDRNAYLVRPTRKVDPRKRWVWIFPFWLGINDGHGQLQHRFYVDRYLSAGFHIAGIDVGTSCGSASAAGVCEEFYTLLTQRYGLAKKVRVLGQSNGGLMAYAWAFRHPDRVDRIAGICPATDFRTWPSLPNVINFPEKGLGYDLSFPELTRRIGEFNPIDNLAPLAKHGVKILHIHGDRDELVPTDANSFELSRRYAKLGGHAEIVVLKGLGHGGIPLYESEPFIKFLLAD